MQIDDDTFRRLATLAGVEKLSKPEAAAIVAIADLAVEADRDEEPEEVSLFDELARHVWALAGVTGASVPAEPHVPEDDPDALADQLYKLALPLRGHPSAQLAYTIGYLIAVVDLQLAPEESAFVDALASALDVAEDRADELAAKASELVTAG